MADADKAQQKSVDKVFGVDCNIVHLMGLFHVAKQVYEKARGLDANVFAMIHRGVHGLHFTVNSSDAVHVKWSGKGSSANVHTTDSA
ncbi:uncharacterized protein PITG_02179 [Phytophthora infestans T30-4]|uniref:Uncharacterized protein n=1 Tax=Phytophthora infestans (strain T30-4) TaxID=403677 RepID=D0MVP1_PHYIT|nr:uncharacterized protein PITG_02179 [Phytophthora infestans T30-4]EEY63704.1 hypothetical protein PITG_02179 [Phytophthora infestans T30-4]|eukprot:XP_002907140.1 hypothetical protein PITG_02179 [Phytophthora infestans T30-4]